MCALFVCACLGEQECVCASALEVESGGGGEKCTGQVREEEGAVLIAAARPIIKEKQHSQQEAEG